MNSINNHHGLYGKNLRINNVLPHSQPHWNRYRPKLIQSIRKRIFRMYPAVYRQEIHKANVYYYMSVLLIYYKVIVFVKNWNIHGNPYYMMVILFPYIDRGFMHNVFMIL
ncbi:hypothetical protein BLA29_009332 [Euroglyphus maynei]|uniref:Uncharacterized protein n=1 Tax=Euroglyphus maynei TaxID=6958 RepID=A0A1Y3BQA7_EURMA|nr:hypothetical protein BLA29_009332 [Euroglyphus maynei]